MKYFKDESSFQNCMEFKTPTGWVRVMLDRNMVDYYELEYGAYVYKGSFWTNAKVPETIYEQAKCTLTGG